MVLTTTADRVISFCPSSLGSNIHHQHHLQEAGDVNVNVVHHLHCIALHGSIALQK